MGQLNIQADAFDARPPSTFIGGLHNTPAPACHYSKARLTHKVRRLFRQLVIVTAGFFTSRTKHRYGRSYIRKLLKPFHKFGHNPKDAPWLFRGQFTVFRHRQSPEIETFSQYISAEFASKSSIFVRQDARKTKGSP